jgi:hypothetical protein
MFANTQIHGQTIEGSHASDDLSRVELASLAYREFYARCFWHCPRDLSITESLIPMVERGLRMYGGHEGFRLARVLHDLGEPRDLVSGCR